MAKATCSVDGCERAAIKRGWCNMHHQRWKKHGDVGGPAPLVAPGAGRKKLPPRPCTVDHCGGHISARGWCVKHYTRWVTRGTLAEPTIRRPQSGTCIVHGCDRTQRKRNLCVSHYSQMQRRGTVDDLGPILRWATEKCCVVCGVTEWTGTGRRFCSRACQQMHQRWGTERPVETPCRLCGVMIDLTATGKAGRLKRATVKLCFHCRSITRTPVSASWLATRDGPDCGICGQPVDMTLRSPERMRPSVDHVHPRAAGGSNDPKNLQLAHLWCNQVKNDSVNGVA